MFSKISMETELCNDGRCKRVRLGEGRHPSHIGKKDKDEITDAQRKLAFLQVGIAVIVTLGSVLIAMSLSQQTTSTVIGMTSNLINDTATSQVFQEQSKEILKQAEKEADIILWEGGNNDLSFYKSDLYIVVTDPHRAGHELTYYPGFVNFLMADVVVINKIDIVGDDVLNKVKKHINPHIMISAHEKINTDKLKDKIFDKFTELVNREEKEGNDYEFER